jgi:uncharacterized protein (DUF302 family)
MAIVTIETGFEVKLALPFEQALEKVISELKTEGFGVLTSINVQATLKEKLGEDFRPYIILGACNPPLAHRALSADPEIGLMLPCNVTVEAGATGETIVRIVNPEAMMLVGGGPVNPEINQVAKQARLKLENVASALASA